MSPEDLMAAYYTAYNSEDADQVAQLLEDTVVLVSAAGTQEGLDAYLDTYRYMTTTFVDRMTPTNITVEDGDAVVDIVNTLTARADVADFMGAQLKAGETWTLNLRGRYTVSADKISFIHVELT